MLSTTPRWFCFTTRFSGLFPKEKRMEMENMEEQKRLIEPGEKLPEKKNFVDRNAVAMVEEGVAFNVLNVFEKMKTNNAGTKKYPVYEIRVRNQGNEIALIECMRSDLSFDVFPPRIRVFARKNGEYTNWRIVPEPMSV